MGIVGAIHYRPGEGKPVFQIFWVDGGDAEWYCRKMKWRESVKIGDLVYHKQSFVDEEQVYVGYVGWHRSKLLRATLQDYLA